MNITWIGEKFQSYYGREQAFWNKHFRDQPELLRLPTLSHFTSRKVDILTNSKFSFSNYPHIKRIHLINCKIEDINAVSLYEGQNLIDRLESWMIPILLKLYDVSCEGNQLTLPFDMLMGHNYLISNKYQLLIETSLPPQNVSAVIECCADTIKWKQSPTLHNPVVWYINSQIIASNTLTRPMPNVYEAVLNQTHPIYGFCLTTTVKPESVWLWLDNNLIVKFENLVELLPNSYFLPLTINKQRIQDYQLDSAPISLSQAKIAKIRLVYAHTNHQTPDIHLATLTYRYSYINSIGTDSGYNKLPLGTIGASETVVAVGALSPLPLSLPMIPISIGSNALSTIGSSKTAIGSRSLRSSKYPITENTVVGMRSYSTWR